MQITQRNPMRKMMLAIVLGLVWLLGSVLSHAGTHPLNNIIYSSPGDPTVGAGVAAPLWQLLIRTDTGAIYYKSGSASTAWTPMSSGSSGITGSGTANTMTKWTGASAIGNATGLTQTTSGTLDISGTPGSVSLTIASTTTDGVVSTRTATAGTADLKAAVFGKSLGTYDTTAGQIYVYGTAGWSTGTRSAGANNLNNWGVYGLANGAQNTIGTFGAVTGGSDAAGVLGLSDATGTAAYGLRGNARGAATTNYGVFATASGGGTNYSGYFDAGSFYVNGASTFGSTVAVTGTLTADGGLRVFDVAGDGLTSSTNTVNVIAATGGGLTANANDLQMTYCAANEVPKMNAGGTAWACGTAGSAITESTTAPTLSSCGTSPTVAAHNVQFTTNRLVSFTVTGGTGSASACTATFAAAFSAEPTCTATATNSGSNQTLRFSATSASAVTVNSVFTIDGNKWHVICLGPI